MWSLLQKGTKEIFLRSIDNRSMKYVEFIGDGVVVCFRSVKEACYQKYGDDCVAEGKVCGACAKANGNRSA